MLKGSKICNFDDIQNKDMAKAKTNLARCLEGLQKYEEALEEYKKIEKECPQKESAFYKDKIEKMQKKVDEIN